MGREENKQQGVTMPERYKQNVGVSSEGPSSGCSSRGAGATGAAGTTAPVAQIVWGQHGGNS